MTLSAYPCLPPPRPARGRAADPGRLRILSLIQAQPEREACVCHLTDALGLSQPTVSHHLRVLVEAHLVDRERRGNWVYYRTVPGALDDLRSALGDSGTREPPDQGMWLTVRQSQV